MQIKMETKNDKKNVSSLQLTELSREKEPDQPETSQSTGTETPSENVEQPIRGRLKCKNVSVLIYLSIFIVLLFIGGSVFLIYYYFREYSSAALKREMVYWSFCFFLISFLVFLYLCTYVYLGVTGKITKKPFDRPINPNWSFEIGINGKFYLWRNFLFENFELAFQLYNYSFYACSMSSFYLIFYGALIGAECCGRAVVRKDVDLPIANSQKKKEMIFDFATDAFVLLYPICVVWFYSKLPFRDSELSLIIAGPFICLILKILIVVPEEIALLVKIDKDHQVEIFNGRTASQSQRRMLRRSSISGAEANVRNAQNKQCPRPLKIMVFVVSLLWGIFFLSLASIQAVNNLVRSPSEIYRSFCKVNTPSCDNWFTYRDNCFHIRYLTTKDVDNADRILEEFITSSATKLLEIAFLNDTSVMKGRFPTLRRLILYSPKDTSMVRLENWPQLVYFSMVHGHNMKTIDGCCGPTTPPYVLYLEDLPNLKLERLEIPHIRTVMLSDFEMPKKVSAPSVAILHLRGMNLTRLPKSLDNKVYSELDVSRNKLTTLSASATKIIDIRFNELKDYDKTARYSYAHGNIVCPKGFDCSPFCHPKCSNKWYYPNKMPENEIYCRYQCVSYCPITKPCKNFFNA